LSVLLRLPRRESPRIWRVCAGVCAIVCAAILMARAANPDQPVGDAVGIIDGDEISVTGPVTMEVVAGQTKTILRSGSDVRVKSGRARISLLEGGQISICGPAHLSLLKAGGSLTVALESGVIHVRIDREPGLTVYTAQIQGQPVAIGDEPRELLVGFESSGLMCIRTYRGAMRLENQLNGQSVMVPQGGDVLLTNGQIESLRTGAGHCSCDLQIADAPRIPPAGPGRTAASDESARTELEGNAADSAAGDEKPASKEEPIYEVILPPLRYDANAKVQPEPDPRLMVIVRRVRVRPTLIFQGRVEGDAAVQSVAAVKPAGVKPANPAPATQPPVPQPKDDSVVNRVRAFLRNLFS